MEQLAEYLIRHNVTQQLLASRAGVATSMIGLIKSGRRRPSPEVAKRIEKATNGEVSAAGLLGLAKVEPSRPRDLGDGRWSATSSGGDVVLPQEMLAALGFPENDVLVFRRDGDRVLITSQIAALDRLRAELRKHVPEGVSLVDELIAERRSEAAREEAETVDR